MRTALPRTRTSDRRCRSGTFTSTTLPRGTVRSSRGTAKANFCDSMPLVHPPGHVPDRGHCVQGDEHSGDCHANLLHPALRPSRAYPGRISEASAMLKAAGCDVEVPCRKKKVTRGAIVIYPPPRAKEEHNVAPRADRPGLRRAPSITHAASAPTISTSAASRIGLGARGGGVGSNSRT